MSKVNLVPITGAQNVSAINDNFQKVAEALNDKVLYRGNPRNEPNQMGNDLDMNEKRIYNLPEPVLDHEPVRKKEFGDVKKSLRVSDRELPPLPSVAERRNKLVSFDSDGNPEVRLPSADSATELRYDLTTFIGNISADAQWSDVPAHSDPAFDLQAQALVNRTDFLKSRVDAIPDEVDAAGTAEQKVGEHNSNPNAHPEMHDFISAEADRAEAARDAAIAAAGPLYATIEEGRAAVADGDTFSVQGDGNSAAAIYRRTSATSQQLMATLPSKQYADAAYNNGRQWRIAEGGGRVVVDPVSGVVRYSALIAMRPDQNFRRLYHSSGETVPIELPTAGNSVVFHYVDMTSYGVVPNEELFKSITGGAMPEQSENIIPLGVSWFGKYQSYQGIEANKQDRPMAHDMFVARGALIYDTIDIYGGGSGSVYVPRVLYLRSRNAGLFGSASITASNAECVEKSGYCKLEVPLLPSQIYAVFYDRNANEFKVSLYSSVTPAAGDYGYVIVALIWQSTITSPSGFEVLDTSKNMIANQCNYSFGSDVDKAPWKYNGTVAPINSADLLSIGLSSGVQAYDAYYGGPAADVQQGMTVTVRCYLERDSGDGWPQFARCYLWNDGSPAIQTINLSLQKTLGSDVRMYEGSAVVSTATTVTRITVGGRAASGKVMRVAGVQWHIGFNTGLIHPKDYPRYVSQESGGVDIESLDASAVAMSAARQMQDVRAQKPTAKYNAKVVYGQSLAQGRETWPSLSRVAKYGNVTLGETAICAASDGSTYPVFGAYGFQPLVAKTSNNSVNTLLSDVQVAALPAGDGAIGEPINYALCNFTKKLHNDALLVENDEARIFATVNPSVAGRTIEQLSKVNTQDSTNRYGRFVASLNGMKTAAGSDSLAVDCIAWLQGENNYTNQGGSWNKASYKALFGQLISDMIADCKTVTGQSNAPAFLTYQTGASYTRDADSSGVAGLHVGMAQLETVLERNDCWMVGPVYPYTDKGAHLDSNGSRWLGNQFAKVWNHVVLKGKRWLPLMPVQIMKTGDSELYVTFHVPQPPLKFDLPYVVNAATDYVQKGFKVTDASGNNSISSIEIVGSATVKITTTRSITASAHLWYADKALHNGNGCLRDSDSTVANDVYEYLPDSGMYPSADIPALVGKPYPLHNWCVAFYLPVGYKFSG